MYHVIDRSDMGWKPRQVCHLYCSDGKYNGLPSFILSVRDANLQSLPGVVVGDLNGIDNGLAGWLVD